MTEDTVPQLNRLDGKVVAVTGAAQGLGETFAVRAAELGARVALLDINGDACARLAERLRATGAQAEAITCDVADEASVQAAAERTLSSLGPCDALVNNAGIISWAPLEDLNVDEWERVMRINVTGVFLTTKHFGRQMIEQRRGSVVNIASVAGTEAEPRSGAYAASKAAVIMMSKQVAVEWGPYGIRGNTISPGMMQTPMAERFLSVPEALKRRKEMVASRRIGRPEEVADAIAFLASDASSYVNGQNLEVDGGMMRMMIELLPRPGVPKAPDVG